MEKSVLSIILAVGVAAVVVAGAAVLFGTDSSATDMPQVEMPGASDPSGNAGAGAPSQGTVAPESTQAQKATEDADDDAGEPEPTAAPATPEPTAAPTAEPTAEPTVSGSAGMAAYDGNDDSSPVTTRPVTDMKGNTVTIPYNVERVVCLYAPASAMVMAIDGGSADSLVGVDGDARDDEGFNAIDPTMADKTVVVEADGSLNKETLLSLDPDVIIAKTCGPAPDFTGIDVPVVWIDTASLSNIDAALTLIGDVRNKHSRATELVGYVQQKRNAILDATCDIPAADHETMYLSGSAPLKTFAGGKFHEEWANGAGCDLVSADLAGSYKPTVSIETIIDWDPELIILSHNLCTSDVTGDPAWQDINAVEHGHVYCIPRFVGDWASPVPESVLGMMWIANGTYHDCVNFDMVQETEDFYDLFYNYDMTDDEACELMGAFPACRMNTVTDMTGNDVDVPYFVERAVTLYTPAAAMVMAVDGNADHLVGIDQWASIDEGFQAIDPRIAEIPVISSTGIEVNKEEILATDPDVIIAGSWSAGGLEGVDIPIVYLTTNSIADVDQALTVIGDVFNKEDRADELVSYLETKRTLVTDATDSIPNDERDNLYLTWGTPLRTFAGGEFHQEWAEDAGCLFASAELVGFRQQVNLEQVLTWNPDIIMLAKSESPSEVLDDPEWQDVSAVQTGKVYRTPCFVGDWASPVPESVLGMMWIANGTYHDDISLNMVQETEEFYNTFYSYDMDENEAREIMGAFPGPATKGSAPAADAT